MLNALQIIFLILSLFYTPVLYLVYKYEESVPAFILRAVQYGAFSYKGDKARFMKKLDLPKNYSRHFYLFACAIVIANLVYMIVVYVFDFHVDVYYASFLKALHGNTSPVSVLAAVTALCLLALQTFKRTYETHCLQVFAKSGKIYLTHYIIGFFYYLAMNAAIVGQAPLFCGDKNRAKIVWADFRTIIVLVPAVSIFLWAWREQHKANIILANLRKDKKSGQVITEDHKVPHGRLFESISSPHRFCEVILYAMFFSILQTTTFFCIFLWVLCNQIQSSLMVHRWYKNTFPDYPKERYAIFKGIL